MLRFFLSILLSVSLLADSSAYFNQVANAIYLAEGGSSTKYPYGIRSVKTKSADDARAVCLRTIQNRYRDWETDKRPGDFIKYLAKTYAPTSGVSLKEANLNKNWPKNVEFFMSKGLTNWNDVLAFENERRN